MLASYDMVEEELLNEELNAGKNVDAKRINLLVGGFYDSVLRLTGYDKIIKVGKTTIDLLSYSSFLFIGYKGFYHVFDDIVECGQNPNIAKVTHITPSQSRYDKTLVLGIHGYDLNKILDIQLSHCTKIDKLEFINDTNAVIQCSQPSRISPIKQM